MNHRTAPLNSFKSYEEFEAAMFQELGIASSALRLKRAIVSCSMKHRVQDGSERQALKTIFAGKTGKERVALVRANKERIRSYLGLTHGREGQRVTKRGFLRTSLK